MLSPLAHRDITECAGALYALRPGSCPAPLITHRSQNTPCSKHYDTLWRHRLACVQNKPTQLRRLNLCYGYMLEC